MQREDLGRFELLLTRRAARLLMEAFPLHHPMNQILSLSLLASSLFWGGCESLNSLATLAGDMGKSKLPTMGAHVKLAAPDGGYLGKPAAQGKIRSISLSPTVEGAEVLAIGTQLAGLVYGDGKELILLLADPSSLPPDQQANTRLGVVTGNRVGYLPETAAPETYTWTLEPVHVNTKGKAYMYGDLIRLRNKASGHYLRATANGVEFTPTKGDALWALEYVKPPAPPAAPATAPATK